MNGLSCGEESMTICSTVLIQCQRVTDGQTDGRTDGQTDVQPISITCFSIADARNKTKRIFEYYDKSENDINFNGNFSPNIYDTLGSQTKKNDCCYKV